MGRCGSGGDKDCSRDNPRSSRAEVVKQDIHLDESGALTYRTKLQLSFKYEREH
jgi:hypothetical protein